MPRKENSAFEKVFPRGELLRGGALWSCLLQTCATVFLVLMLIDVYLLTHLLIHEGRFSIPLAEREELEELIGNTTPEVRGEENAPAQNAAAVSVTETGNVVFDDPGLLPVVWADRYRPWGRTLVAAYKQFPALREDGGALAILLGALALFSFARTMVESRARSFAMHTALAIASRLRQSIHRQSLRLSPSDLEGKESAESLHLFTTVVDQLRDGVFNLVDRLGRDPIRVLLLLALGFAVHWKLALQCVIPLGACWYLVRRQRVSSDESRRLSEALSANELRLLAESLMKTRLVRGFGMENFERDQFQKYLQRFQDKVTQGWRAKAWSQRGVRLLAALCLALVLYLVAGRVMLPPHDLSFASGVLLLTTLGAVYFPLQRLSRLSAEHEPAELSASRIQTYLGRIPEVGQAVGAKFLQPLSKMLEFEKVVYTLPGKRELLRELTLRIKAGRQVAIVSTDPLESLTLAYMLPRFIEPQSGRIIIDGEDISWVTLESLRAETIFVGGKDPFLTGTVRDNISVGSSTTSLQEVTEAAKAAHAHSFILKLPQGYETVIGEHGEQLDAGQGFRLGLARAILRKPALLVIEEPAEHLDEDTKDLIDDTYTRLAQKRTTIFLARRMSTLRRADEIVFIHHGRVAAIGPHDRIVQTSQLYRHWEYINFNEFRHEFETE